ncbi:hypothetical protein Tco_1034241, partial [Tanacetum coccineum]
GGDGDNEGDGGGEGERVLLRCAKWNLSSRLDDRKVVQMLPKPAVAHHPPSDPPQTDSPLRGPLMSTWMAFGGNTRNLRSSGEETNKTIALYQIS